MRARTHERTHVCVCAHTNVMQAQGARRKSCASDVALLVVCGVFILGAGYCDDCTAIRFETTQLRRDGGVRCPPPPCPAS